MSEAGQQGAVWRAEAAVGSAAGAVQWAAVTTLWWREVVRFVRQRSRLLGAFAQPLVFWLLLGGGFYSSFRPPDGQGTASYMAYFYPGVIALVLLFTAIFATIAVVEDRQAGFLQGVLVAPVSRTSIILGQSLGCTTLAVAQGGLFLCFAPFTGLRPGPVAVLATLGVELLLAFGLTNLGLIIAWRMDSTQGFHAIMNLILLPIWLLSGAFFPASGASGWLAALMQVNPLTYGMAALRRALYASDPGALGPLPPLWPSLAVILFFALVTFWVAVRTAERARGV
jgi:ABC-2 type transport system permease protein